MTEHEKLLTCYRSGQMSERQWQEHLRDEKLRQWLEKQGHTTPHHTTPT